MSPRTLALMFGILASTLATSIAFAGELPDKIQVGEVELQLNGWGTRSKTFVKLYDAGLYLTAPSNDSAAIMAADEPMAIRIQITSGFVSQAKLVASLNEGFKQSTGGNVAPIQQQMKQFRDCFKEVIDKKDVFDIVYVPDKGVIVNKNGVFRGRVEGLEFKKALFGIWLSDAPADSSLKQAMLAQRPAR